MHTQRIIEPISLIVSVAVFFFSFFLFYSDTQSFLGSIFAALMAAALTWISYVIIRLLVLSLKEK